MYIIDCCIKLYNLDMWNLLDSGYLQSNSNHCYIKIQWQKVSCLEVMIWAYCIDYFIYIGRNFHNTEH